MVKFIGHFVRQLWRNNGNGKELFVFSTKQMVPPETVYGNPVLIKNKMEGVEETYFKILCGALDISIKAYSNGMPLLCEGEFVQFNGQIILNLTSVEENTDDLMATVSYLSSKEIGLSFDDSVKIAAEFGSKLFEEVSNNPDLTSRKMLSLCPGLDINTVEEVIKKLSNTVEERKVFSYLAPVGVSYAYAAKAVKKWGNKALYMLYKDPFKFARILGFGYTPAERIAKGFGMLPYDKRRIDGLKMSIMGKVLSNGNTYMDYNGFFKAVMYADDKSAYSDGNYRLSLNELKKQTKGLEVVNNQGHMVVVNEKVNEKEQNAAKQIKRLFETRKPIPGFSEDLLEQAMSLCDIKLATQQKEAVRMAFKYGGVNILTGGPGTGKTTVLNTIITVYRLLKSLSGQDPTANLRLFATTARAAQRSAEVTGVDASTVHRGLNYRPYGDEFVHKDQNDPIDADFIIVDEVSMMDSKMLSMFLTAVKNGTTVILVGDIHQLESVEVGAVLRDLLRVPKKFMPRIMLTEVFRQKGDSLIIDNANKINSGDTSLDVGKDFQIRDTYSPEESMEVVKDFMLHNYDQENPFKAQILCPARGGKCGINAMNKELQELLNHEKYGILYKNTVFKKGDKIMIKKNDYRMGLFNGDIGVIQEVDLQKNSMQVLIRNENFELGPDKLADIVLAYAISIHKSQGSEFQYAICVLPTEPASMLVRNLTYTAVTRAKKMAFVINEQGRSLQKSIVTDNSEKRLTLLYSYMKEFLKF